MCCRPLYPVQVAIHRGSRPLGEEYCCRLAQHPRAGRVLHLQGSRHSLSFHVWNMQVVENVGDSKNESASLLETGGGVEFKLRPLSFREKHYSLPYSRPNGEKLFGD